jgi:adenylate kinase
MELCRAAGLELRAVVVLMLAEEEVRRRLMGRRVCPRCGAAYHLEYDPPKVQGRCDQCGAALVQREDDHPEKVALRLASYRQLTVPVIEAFERDQPDCTQRVSGETSPESLLVTVTELFEKLGVLP